MVKIKQNQQNQNEILRKKDKLYSKHNKIFYNSQEEIHLNDRFNEDNKT